MIFLKYKFCNNFILFNFKDSNRCASKSEVDNKLKTFRINSYFFNSYIVPDDINNPNNAYIKKESLLARNNYAYDKLFITYKHSLVSMDYGLIFQYPILSNNIKISNYVPDQALPTQKILGYNIIYNVEIDTDHFRTVTYVKYMKIQEALANLGGIMSVVKIFFSLLLSRVYRLSLSFLLFKDVYLGGNQKITLDKKRYHESQNILKKSKNEIYNKGDSKDISNVNPDNKDTVNIISKGHKTRRNIEYKSINNEDKNAYSNFIIEKINPNEFINDDGILRMNERKNVHYVERILAEEINFKTIYKKNVKNLPLIEKKYNNTYIHKEKRFSIDLGKENPKIISQILKINNRSKCKSHKNKFASKNKINDESYNYKVENQNKFDKKFCSDKLLKNPIIKLISEFNHKKLDKTPQKETPNEENLKNIIIPTKSSNLNSNNSKSLFFRKSNKDNNFNLINTNTENLNENKKFNNFKFYPKNKNNLENNKKKSSYIFNINLKAYIYSIFCNKRYINEPLGIIIEKINKEMDIKNYLKTKEEFLIIKEFLIDEDEIELLNKAYNFEDIYYSIKNPLINKNELKMGNILKKSFSIK